MRQGEPIRAYLELECSGDTIAGRLLLGEDERPFAGWMELVAAIETVWHGSAPRTKATERG